MRSRTEANSLVLSVLRLTLALGVILVGGGSACAQGALVAGRDSPEYAQGMALAKAKACLGCHLIDEKRVGPAYVQIANRYAGQESAVESLSNSLRKGGRGRWGAVPMPAQSHVTESEARQLAQWILSLK